MLRDGRRSGCTHVSRRRVVFTVSADTIVHVMSYGARCGLGAGCNGRVWQFARVTCTLSTGCDSYYTAARHAMTARARSRDVRRKSSPSCCPR